MRRDGLEKRARVGWPRLGVLPALCTHSASASSAWVSAQSRYCFHMFLQEIIGVRSASSPWSEC